MLCGNLRVSASRGERSAKTAILIVLPTGAFNERIGAAPLRAAISSPIPFGRDFERKCAGHFPTSMNFECSWSPTSRYGCASRVLHGVLPDLLPCRLACLPVSGPYSASYVVGPYDRFVGVTLEHAYDIGE